jgi:hypothetical protein
MILLKAEPEYFILYSEYDTDWTTEESGFDSLNNMKFIVISEVYRSAPQSKQLPLQYVSAAIFWAYSRTCVN